MQRFPTNSRPMQPMPVKRGRPTQGETLSLGVKYASLYFFLVFAVWPLTIPIFPVGSLGSRLPLLVMVWSAPIQKGTTGATASNAPGWSFYSTIKQLERSEP